MYMYMYIFKIGFPIFIALSSFKSIKQTEVAYWERKSVVFAVFADGTFLFQRDEIIKKILYYFHSIHKYDDTFTLQWSKNFLSYIVVRFLEVEQRRKRKKKLLFFSLFLLFFTIWLYVEKEGVELTLYFCFLDSLLIFLGFSEFFGLN